MESTTTTTHIPLDTVYAQYADHRGIDGGEPELFAEFVDLLTRTAHWALIPATYDPNRLLDGDIVGLGADDDNGEPMLRVRFDDGTLDDVDYAVIEISGVEFASAPRQIPFTRQAA
ncbi:MAG: hypothetical protein AAGA90_20470 [Actinomycetota bacterium]